MLYSPTLAYADRGNSRAVACLTQQITNIPPMQFPALHCHFENSIFLYDQALMIAEQAKLKILQQLALKPDSSQRELAQAVGISLGSVNFCLQALMEKGCIKMHNFRNKKKKLTYAYLLTPTGIKEKMLLTAHFLERKMQEYEALRSEIEALRLEVEMEASSSGAGSGARI